MVVPVARAARRAVAVAAAVPVGRLVLAERAERPRAQAVLAAVVPMAAVLAETQAAQRAARRAPLEEQAAQAAQAVLVARPPPDRMVLREPT